MFHWLSFSGGFVFAVIVYLLIVINQNAISNRLSNYSVNYIKSIDNSNRFCSFLIGFYKKIISGYMTISEAQNQANDFDRFEETRAYYLTSNFVLDEMYTFAVPHMKKNGFADNTYNTIFDAVVDKAFELEYLDIKDKDVFKCYFFYKMARILSGLIISINEASVSGADVGVVIAYESKIVIDTAKAMTEFIKQNNFISNADTLNSLSLIMKNLDDDLSPYPNQSLEQIICEVLSQYHIETPFAKTVSHRIVYKMFPLERLKEK